MLYNAFKTGFRNWRKNKVFSFINLAGLSLGTLCCLYILLYVQDQYRFDLHHRHAEDLYRVNTSFGWNASIWTKSFLFRQGIVICG